MESSEERNHAISHVEADESTGLDDALIGRSD